MNTDRPGEVITFYSYKGGTGRTMALANIACLLARRDESGAVLMVDWDLEAPGLHRFFSGRLLDGHGRPWDMDADEHPGLIDLFSALAENVPAASEEQSEDDARGLLDSIDLDAYLLQSDLPDLFLLKAGRFDEGYPTRVNTFAWEPLHKRSPWLFGSLAEHLMGRFRYVLIDSRTGMTDSGGICTMLMPEKLVVVFTPNAQSLTGVTELVGRAIGYRQESDDLRPLVVFPLASRIELSEEELRKLWRKGGPEEDLVGYQPQFEEAFKAAYDLDECDLEAYFDDVQVQYVPSYSYGEKLAVLLESGSERLSLSRSYESFTERLVTLAAPWEPLHPPAPTAPETRPTTRFVNLPPDPGPDRFLDRATEIGLLKDALRSDGVGLIVVIGRSGVGKSTLVSRALREVASEDPHEAVPIDAVVLVSTRGPMPLTAPTVLEHLGRLLPDTAGRPAPLFTGPRADVSKNLDTITDALAGQRVVLVIDDLDELMDPSTQEIREVQLEELLRALLRLPQYKVILTTRIPPRTLVRVQPSRQQLLDLDGLPLADAASLLRGLDADGTLGLVSTPDDQLTMVYERTGGNPKALEILYSVLRLDRDVSLSELLDDTAQLLPDEVADFLVGEAFDRLDPAARGVMQGLAVYGRPVAPAAVDHLLEPWISGQPSTRTLSRLVGMHLAHKVDHRYSLSPVERQYLLARIPRGRDEDRDLPNPPFTQVALLSRGADYFERTRAPVPKGIDDLGPQLMEIDLRARGGEHELAAWLLLQIDTRYLLTWGYSQLVLDQHTALEGKLHDPALAQASIATMGSACVQLGNLEEAVGYFRQALQLSEPLEDNRARKRLLTNLGSAYYELGQTSRAMDHYEQALELARDEPAERPGPLSGLALCDGERGRFPAAIARSTEVYAIARDIGDRRLQAEQLANLGSFEGQRGNSSAAIDRLERGLDIAREIGYRLAQGLCLCNKAEVLIDQGRVAQAITVAAEAVVVGQEIGSAPLIWSASHVHALANLFNGDLPAARVAVDQACRYGSGHRTFMTFALQGVIALRQGQEAAAGEAWDSAIRGADQFLAEGHENFAALDAKGLALSGLAFLGQGNLDQAVAAYLAARRITSEPGVVNRAQRLLVELALVAGAAALEPARAASANDAPPA
jgi:tetratricopeptide (TPR) repeat protein